MSSEGSGPEPAFDAAVVGGGIVGLCLAWFLAEEGCGVVVVDDGRHAGTTTNAGSLHVQMQSRFMRLYPDLVPGLEATLPLYPMAVAFWRELVNRLETDVQLNVSGGLMVAERSSMSTSWPPSAREERALGLEVAMLDRRDLDRIAPYLGPAIVGAELCATEGKVNPLLVNQALRQRAITLGVVHRTEERVLGMERVGAGFRLRTSRGTLRTGRIVIAAGAGTRDLGAMVGVTVPAEAEPLHMNVTEPTVPLIQHLVQHADRPITLKQLAAGQVVIGGGWPARLVGPDRFPTVQVSSLRGERHPGPARCAADRATSADPHLGRDQHHGGWSLRTGGRAWGAGRHVRRAGDAGYTLGPLCARIVADLVSAASHQWTQPYTPERFAPSA